MLMHDVTWESLMCVCVCVCVLPQVSLGAAYHAAPADDEVAGAHPIAASSVVDFDSAACSLAHALQRAGASVRVGAQGVLGSHPANQWLR